MKIPVKFLNFNPTSPDKGYWDMFLLEQIFQKDDFKIISETTSEVMLQAHRLPIEPTIVIIPARHNYDYVKEINEYINHFSGVLLIIAGDEESLFPVDQIHHKNMKLWLMTPHTGTKYTNVDRFIGEGHTPHTALVSKELPERISRWFFAGQVTHKRRRDCVDALDRLKDGVLIKTAGFTQGIEPDKYIKEMASAKIIPCPGGPATPDTFRFYEALESGCIPIADAFSYRDQHSTNYWDMIFGESYPFPVIRDWNEVEGVINYYYDVFDEKSSEIFAWWQLQKRQVYKNLLQDIDYIYGKPAGRKAGITAIIPTSPIQSHPDTAMLEETINSIRTHLPDEEIFITFDGIRDEQKDLKDNYNEYKKRVLWKCNREWKNVYPIVFNEHMHQSGMMREVLKYIDTDQILYVEHDAPLTPDCSILFDNLSDIIRNDRADLIRFHFEALIPEVHRYLMIGEVETFPDETPLLKTVQWSQRPHLASTEFYERILKDHFSENAKTFIEDRMHGIVVEAYNREQMQGWNKYKLWIYHPLDGNIKRSYHLNGRGSEQKYSMKF